LKTLLLTLDVLGEIFSSLLVSLQFHSERDRLTVDSLRESSELSPDA
jgi:hypothetical protein